MNNMKKKKKYITPETVWTTQPDWTGQSNL